MELMPHIPSALPCAGGSTSFTVYLMKQGTKIVKGIFPLVPCGTYHTLRPFFKLQGGKCPCCNGRYGTLELYKNEVVFSCMGISCLLQNLNYHKKAP